MKVFCILKRLLACETRGALDVLAGHEMDDVLAER